MQAAFLKGEFQDKDPALYCWPPKNGPALPGSLLLILQGVFGLNDAPRKWWEMISKVLVQVGFRKQRMCRPNEEITISMKAYIQNLEKVFLTRERMKQLDDEFSATESHEFRGINGCLQWVTKGLLYLFQFVVKVLQRRQGQEQVRDMIKANEVIDEIKQHEDFTLTHRVLDLTPCGLIGVSDASLGGVDLFGYPTFIGEKSLASVGARG